LQGTRAAAHALFPNTQGLDGTGAFCERGGTAQSFAYDDELSRHNGPRESEDISPIAKSAMLFKQFTTLDDALSWARHVDREDRVPLLIEGDDGTRMDRRAIGDALRVGQREQIGQ